MHKKLDVLKSTNAGTKIADKEATRKGYSKGLYNPDAMTNLRSSSEMVRRGYWVQMDTDLENAFHVISAGGDAIKFLCDDHSLYILEQVNQTKGFFPRTVERAKRAKKLYYNLNATSLGNLKILVRSNQGKNVPVSINDVKPLEHMKQKTYP